MNDFDQLFGGISFERIGIDIGRRQILPHVFLEHLRHQAVDRSARRSDALEQIRAARLAGEGALDRIHLTAQPAHPVDQPPLVAERAGG